MQFPRNFSEHRTVFASAIIWKNVPLEEFTNLKNHRYLPFDLKNIALLWSKSKKFSTNQIRDRFFFFFPTAENTFILKNNQ